MRVKRFVVLITGFMMLFYLTLISFGGSFLNPVFNEINTIMQSASYLRYDEKSSDVSIYEAQSVRGNSTLNYEKISVLGLAYNRLTFEDCGSVDSAIEIYEAFIAQSTELTYVETQTFPDSELNIDIEVAVLYSTEQAQGESHAVEPKVIAVASRIGQMMIYEYDGGLWSIGGMAINYQMFYGLLSRAEYGALDYDFYIDESAVAFVADGKGKIALHLEFPEGLNGNFELEYDKTNGVIEEIEPFTEMKVTESNRIFKLSYVPKTEGVNTDDYMVPMSINVPVEGENLLWCREDLIKLKFTKEDDTFLDQEILVKVARPPVVFVHGFLGDLDTWKTMDEEFTEHAKLLTMRLGYYGTLDGAQSVAAQAEKLFFDIELLDQAYLDAGVKMNRVDLIAHSMGGLVARYLTSEHDLYEGTVRKLIMVGTPNHGCSYVDLNAGRVLSYASSAHEAAAEDLYSGSEFIRNLNRAESSGGHLAPEVEYAVIYGTGINGGDGIVTESSATLNGVKRFGLANHLHSDSMDYGFTDSLTESGEVRQIVTDLLNAFIDREPLSEQTYEITNTSGDVRLFRAGINEEVLKEGTMGLTFFNADLVKTGRESAALITLKADGKAYGEIYVKADSELELINASVNRVDVILRSGGARFVTFADSDQHFSVQAYSKQNAYAVQRITGLDTDFTAELGQEAEVNFVLIDGRGIVEVFDIEAQDRKELILNDPAKVKVRSMTIEHIKDFDTKSPEHWWVQLENLKPSKTPLALDLDHLWLYAGAAAVVLLVGTLIVLKKRKA